MDAILDGSLGLPALILLFVALFLALGFEFVNGFHDTANAVATVIYTHSLPPYIAVILSGTCNFIGVLTSSGAVAFGIVALLPVELIINVGSNAGFAMVFALLCSAIIWNVGTWYLGLPASSSHTLIGSIVGVGLMNSYLQPGRAFGEGVNWGKVHDTGMALLVSPVIGFCLAGLLLLLAKLIIRNPALYREPPKDQPPPWPVRILLWFTCCSVSFAHGSNDGQKGMGLIMLILIGVVPAGFAMNMSTDRDTLADIALHATDTAVVFDALAPGYAPTQLSEDQTQTILSDFLRTGKVSTEVYAALAEESRTTNKLLTGMHSIGEILPEDRRQVRKTIYLVSESIGKLGKSSVGLPAESKAELVKFQKQITGITKFIPVWVKAAVALALGLGTMIGWKRIVVTVGEKIGKAHLTYAQGASAELVAAGTIALADNFGLPVSTTHILSSGIAGTMAANKSGLQTATLRNVLLAWVLTLPVCVFLGAMLFAAGLFFVAHVLGAS
jgi:PiT family inorganic phosphate transporter